MEIGLWVTVENGFEIGFLGLSCFSVSVLVVEAWLESIGARLNRLGLVLCFGGVDLQLVLWVDFVVLAVAEFQFHGGCWRHWVCYGGACNYNVKQPLNGHNNTQATGPTESENLRWCH